MLRALTLLGLLCAGCRPAHQTLADLPPTVTLHGVQIQHFQGNTIDAAGRAARLTYERATTDFIAYEGLMRFPSRGQGGVRSTGGALAGVELRAPEVRGNMGGRTADGMGGVLMRSSAGMIGETERAHFDGIAMTAGGRQSVKVSGPGYQLTAADFIFHFRDETFEFGNPTTRLGGTP